MNSKRIIRLCVLGIVLFFVGNHKSIYAQSYIFSQSYSSPTIVSPSFTGLISKDRLALNFRDQWPGLSTYVTYALTYDHYSKKLRSGFGVQLVKDRAGDGNLAVTTGSLLYSYNLKINKDWFFRPGMAFSYSTRTIDFSKLIFPDMLATGNPATSELGLSVDKRPFIDMTTSVLAYTKKYWAGVTVQHLLRQDVAFIREYQARIPITYILLAGMTIPLRHSSRRLGQRESVSFSTQYRMQQFQDQLDIGAYYTKSPFVVGLWLRGFPVISGITSKANILDAVIILLGYSVGELNIGYSYDLTVSKLLSQSNGAHELSLVYKFRSQVKRSSRRKYAAIPCPGF